VEGIVTIAESLDIFLGIVGVGEWLGKNNKLATRQIMDIWKRTRAW